MVDFLDTLAWDAKETLNEGYYEVATYTAAPTVSLISAIMGTFLLSNIASFKLTVGAAV